MVILLKSEIQELYLQLDAYNKKIGKLYDEKSKKIWKNNLNQIFVFL